MNHSEIQVLTTKERIASLENDFAKQKINLALLTGLPPNDRYELTDKIPFAAAPAMDLDSVIQQAFGHRADLRAAEAQMKAAE